MENIGIASTGPNAAAGMNDLFRPLNAAGIRYLLAGGQAMRFFGMPRFSMDWDLFIPPHDAKCE